MAVSAHADRTVEHRRWASRCTATRVFVPTSDLHVLALDAKTGELMWDHEIAAGQPSTGRTATSCAARRSWSATRSSRA